MGERFEAQVQWNKKPYTLTIEANQDIAQTDAPFMFLSSTTAPCHMVDLRSIVGVDTIGEKLFVDFHVPNARKPTQCTERACFELANFEESKLLKIAIYEKADLKRMYDKRIMVIVNPASGKGKALNVFNQIVHPILYKGGYGKQKSGPVPEWGYEMVKTTHIGHATELIKDREDLCESFDTIVLVGGDGLAHEAINGLLSREDYATKSKAIKIALIPAGSGNGYCQTLGIANPWDAVYYMLRDHSQYVDTFSVWQGDSHKFGFLSLTHAIIADVDILSNHMRWLGDVRFTIQTIIQIMKLPGYKVKLEYLPVERDIGRCQAMTIGCSHCLPDSESFTTSFDLKPPVQDDKLPEGWVSIEDDLLYFLASKATFLDKSTRAAPYACASDGCLDLSWITNEGLGFSSALGIFLKLESGEHVTNPKVNYKKVSALRLTPLGDNGIFSLDGEQQPLGPIQLRVNRASLQIMGPMKCQGTTTKGAWSLYTPSKEEAKPNN